MHFSFPIRYADSALSETTQQTQFGLLIGDRSQLDSLVINIELTLTSIIQGVALSFLCETTTASLGHGRIQDLLYVANGLLLIFLFWSRSVGHTLTLIRWPLDFVHSFFYFGAAFLEAVSFGLIGNPLAWYSTLAGFALVVWLLFILDLRLFRRAAASNQEKTKRLFELLNRDQFLNIAWLVPGFVLFHVCAAWVSATWPATHLVLAGVQFVLFAIYLVYFLRTMRLAFELMEP